MNAKSNYLWGLVGAVVALMYTVYMFLYLNHARKCDQYLSHRDAEFRRVAWWVTLVSMILSGLSVLGMVIALVSNDRGSMAAYEYSNMSL